MEGITSASHIRMPILRSKLICICYRYQTKPSDDVGIDALGQSPSTSDISDCRDQQARFGGVSNPVYMDEDNCEIETKIDDVDFEI